jgi:hypothetical protein
MYMGQLNWPEPFTASGQRVQQGNVVNEDAVEATFSLLFSEAMALSGGKLADSGTSDNWLDSGMNTESGLLDACDSIRLPDTQFNQDYFGMSQYRSNMNPFRAQDQDSQAVHLPTSQFDDQKNLDLRVQSLNNSLPYANPSENLAPLPTSTDVLNKNQLIEWMDAHALSRSSHHCAMYCRLGLEAAGLSTGDRPQTGDAGDYGPFLLRHGAQVISQDSYSPQVGDTVVFDKTGQHPSGHIEIFDGRKWVSDFMQHSFSPYRDASSTPPFTIYRIA